MPTVILERMHSAQGEVYRDPARFKVLNWGRRSGKTRVAIRASEAAALKGGSGFWVAPTYKHTRVAWRPLTEHATRIPGCKVSVSEKTIQYPGGGMIQVRSADDPNSLRSEGLDFVILDEAAFCKPEAWDAVRPALSDRRGWAWFVSTPDGFNHFYDWFNHGKNKPGWESWQFSSERNPFLDLEEIREAKNDLNPTSYAQEYLAHFTAQSGRVFKDFSRERHVSPKAVYDPALPVELGIDFGVRTFAVNAQQVTGDRSWTFWAREYKELALWEALKKLADLPWLREVSLIACDPAGDNRSDRDGMSDVKELRATFPWATVKYSNKPEDRSPNRRANRINDRLWSGAEVARHHLHPDAAPLIEALEKSVFPKHKSGYPEKEDPVKDGVVDHQRDAFGYWVVNRFHHRRARFRERTF